MDYLYDELDGVILDEVDLPLMDEEPEAPPQGEVMLGARLGRGCGAVR
jgi:hypothetical protein